MSRAGALAAAFAAMKDLRARTLTAAAMIVVTVVPIALGGLWATAFVAAVAALMGWEYRRLTAAAAGAQDHGLYAACFAAATFCAGEGAAWTAAGLLLAAGLGFAALDVAARRPPGWPVVGAMLPGVAAAAFAALRAIEGDGLNAVLWVAVIVAATDTGAFFAGRLIGGPKLWPAVSPKKTWAGLGGGVALAALAGLLFSGLTTGTFAEEVCTVSAIAAFVAQAGDLAESALKRRFGAKDSGAIFPGHGGALDRLDGFVAVTLVAAAVTFVRGGTPVFRW